MLKRIIKTFNNFYDERNKTDKEIAELSKELNIDIAIDLMTYTEKNRFGIFIEKCAPIQINFLGINFKISVLKFPVPAPISIIFLFLNEVKDSIFLDIFLSIKKFCPKDFLNFI